MADFVKAGGRWINLDTVTRIETIGVQDGKPNQLRIHFIGGSDVSLADADARAFAAAFESHQTSRQPSMFPVKGA